MGPGTLDIRPVSPGPRDRIWNRGLGRSPRRARRLGQCDQSLVRQSSSLSAYRADVEVPFRQQ